MGEDEENVVNSNYYARKATEIVQRLQRRKEEEQIAQDRQAAAESRFLPLSGFDLGLMPNHINRSSLFAPVARGKRCFHRQTVLVSRSDVTIEYTGEQLDEADCDLMMALIWFAQKNPIGEWTGLNRAELLRSIGRSTGKNDYAWLHRRIRAMTEGTLYIEARRPDGSTKYKIGYAVAFHMITGFEYNGETEMYSFRLDPRWVQLFSNREYSAIDFEKRLQISRGQEMAKALQRLVATSSNEEQRYRLDWLKEKMGHIGRDRDFRISVGKACDELVRLKIISAHRIEESKRKVYQLVIRMPKSRGMLKKFEFNKE